MKPTNKQMATPVTYFDLELMFRRNQHRDMARIVMNRAAELETESLQLDDHVEGKLNMVEPVSKTDEFEVGGTCGVSSFCNNFLVVAIEGSRVYLQDIDTGVVDNCCKSEITNYKPPVRVKAWYSAESGFVTNKQLDLIPYGGKWQLGYWSPKVGV